MYSIEPSLRRKSMILKESQAWFFEKGKTCFIKILFAIECILIWNCDIFFDIKRVNKKIKLYFSFFVIYFFVCLGFFFFFFYLKFLYLFNNNIFLHKLIFFSVCIFFVHFCWFLPFIWMFYDLVIFVFIVVNF